MATIGRKAAVASIHGIRITGFPAWIVWLFVHLMQLVGFRNRIVVFVDWAWQYVFYRPASPIILSIDEETLHSKVLDDSARRT
jgi:NADH dehydrogenase